MSLGFVYIFLFGVGVMYALIAGSMGWLSDLGGGDVHLDASGHLDAGHPHPISGTSVATFVTGFGGAGIVAYYLFKWPLAGQLAFATAAGLVLALAAFGVLELIFSQTQAGAEYTTEEAAGREAEVITGIPPGGTGEVAYVLKGQRESAPARATDGGAIAKGVHVVVERVVGNTAYVRPRG